MKPVYRYNLKGKFVDSFQSQSEAAIYYGSKSFEANIRYAIKNNTEWNGHYWKNSLDNIERRLLVIGDLHEPFTLEKYIDFCYETYNKYNCNEVLFTGDAIDLHFSSFHSIDPDGHSAAQELKMAKANIAKWHELFPNAKVCIGNHDSLPDRKAFSSGVSSQWIKSIGEVLNTPTWKYADEFIIDGVLYCHGIGRKASARMKNDLISVVQGHYHSESYIMYSNGRDDRLFAMQIGCGCDERSYAMAYGKHFNKPHINCGVVLGNGKLPIIEYM